jgi:hypothetical protein
MSHLSAHEEPTMTFAEISARYEAAQVTPIAERRVLTPKGDAAVAVSRLKEQIEALDVPDRADLIEMLAQLARELRPGEHSAGVT